MAANLSRRQAVEPASERVEALIEDQARRHPGCLRAHRVIAAQPARYSPLPAELEPRLAAALRRRGIERLYHHQRLAWERIRAGRHTVLVTPTASGKTLCYNLPVLDAVLREAARALYLFPTKALSQDQVAELVALNQAGGLGVRTFTFDGDTPGDARRAVRSRGDVVVSNPDMLHQGILPHHTKWAQLFESLRYVVIDEMHIYRGVFGAHVANVIRRLQRICRFYGSEPTFVLCSATIANPGELAERLIGAPVERIAESGAPRGERTLVVWNPPLVNRELGIRASALAHSARLTRALLEAGLSCICFARTRTAVEVLTRYLKDRFDADPRRPARIHAYRGGYLPGARRAIERGLRAGEIDCVVATSALELGIDIGALDACVLCGYPGTVAGTWQRLGRAGRRGRPALGVLVTSSLPLDQFLARNPDFLLEASPEQARIDPDQLLVLLDHVRCAAFELPFVAGERLGGAEVGALLEYLEGEGVLHREEGRWHWTADSYPACAVSLRTVAEGNFVVIDRGDGGGRVIAEVDYSSAPLTLYEGAIYLVQARPWQVEHLDWEGRKAFVRRTDADYYTEAIDHTRLKVLERFASAPLGAGAAAHGEVHVVRHVAGYKKIRYYSHENVGYGNVDLPDQQMHTSAAWWEVDPVRLEAAFASRGEALDGFLGAGYAMHHAAALLTMSEPADLGRAVGGGDSAWFVRVGARGRGAEAARPEPGQRFCPTLFLYDNYPGGIGLSEPLFELRAELLERAAALIAGCDCESGCPGCVGPLAGAAEGAPGAPSKHAALAILGLLGARGAARR